VLCCDPTQLDIAINLEGSRILQQRVIMPFPNCWNQGLHDNVYDSDLKQPTDYKFKYITFHLYKVWQ
jgi:hypothetical protein